MKLTTAQFAAQCNPPVKSATVRQWIKRKIIPATKFGRDNEIDSKHLMREARKPGRPRKVQV